MNKAPAFQFYPADYLADMQVRMLSWAARGMYIELLCYCWREGYIPSDSSAIAQLVHSDDIATIEACLSLFIPHESDPKKLVHKRLDAERAKQEEHRKERSESGKKGSAKRWKDKNSSAIKEPMAKNSSSSSFSSSFNTPIVPKGTGNFTKDFEEFWTEYPKKIGKAAAWRSWNGKRHLRPDQSVILKAIELQKSTPQWQKDGGQYIPNPATWINQGRWDDQPDATVTPSGMVSALEEDRRLGLV